MTTTFDDKNEHKRERKPKVPCVLACPRLRTVCVWKRKEKDGEVGGREEGGEMGRERKRWMETEIERRKSKNASPLVLRKHREPICPVCVDRAQYVLFSELKPLPPPPQPTSN